VIGESISFILHILLDSKENVPLNKVIDFIFEHKLEQFDQRGIDNSKFLKGDEINENTIPW